MRSDFTFALDGLAPAEPHSSGRLAVLHEADLAPLVQHHEQTPSGSASWYLLHDTSATWGVPGAAQLRSAVVHRDVTAGTFRFDVEEHALASLGQAWLIRHGCPPEAATPMPDGLLEAADARTTAVENRLATSDGLHLLDAWVDDDRTWVIAQDTQAAERPIRLFLEQSDFHSGTYILQEGAFDSREAAEQWLDGGSGTPLPLPPVSDVRTHVARSRSSSATALVRPYLQTAPPGPRRPDAPGRSR